MKKMLVVLLLSGSLLAGWYLLPSRQIKMAHAQSERLEQKVEPISSIPMPNTVSKEFAPAQKPTEPTRAIIEESEVEFDQEAIASLSHARQMGDDRAPPIHRSKSADSPLPTEAELSDPALYTAYESRQEMKLKADYIKAAQNKLKQIEEQIPIMRAHGVSENDIREAKEKWQAIHEMSMRLQQSHPELSVKP